MISRDRAKELESLIRAAFPAATIKISKNEYGTFWVEIRHDDACATAVFMPNGDIGVFIYWAVKSSGIVSAPRDHPMPSVSEAFEFIAQWLNAESSSCSFVPLQVLQDAMDRAGLSRDFARKGDPSEIRTYGEIRDRLYESHHLSLTSDEHRRFGEGVNRSDENKADEALDVVSNRLCEFLRVGGVAAKVQPAMYHGDRWVLSADLQRDPGSRLAELPWLFSGFEVKYSWPSSNG